MNYPVYALRQFESMEEIDGIIYVNTYYSRYILDDTNIEVDNFLERRVIMLTQKYALKIYPLKYKCDNLIQINRAYRELKYNKFIDRDGNIGTYVPKKLEYVEWKQAKYYPSADGRMYTAVVKGEPYTFVVREPYNYIALITFKGGRHIYDVSNTKPEKEVMWRKI